MNKLLFWKWLRRNLLSTYNQFNFTISFNYSIL